MYTFFEAFLPETVLQFYVLCSLLSVCFCFRNFRFFFFYYFGLWNKYTFLIFYKKPKSDTSFYNVVECKMVMHTVVCRRRCQRQCFYTLSFTLHKYRPYTHAHFYLSCFLLSVLSASFLLKLFHIYLIQCKI